MAAQVLNDKENIWVNGVQLNGQHSRFWSRDPGSKSWLVYCLKFKSKIEFSQITLAYNTLASTITLQWGASLQSMNMKKFEVVLNGKIGHIAQPVYLNHQGWTDSSHWKKIKLAGSENVLNRQGPSKYLKCCTFYSTFNVPVYKFTKLNVYTDK